MQNGLMGEAVFFYWLSRETHNALFEKKADGLLQEVVKKINARLPLDIPNGLLGVSLGICYLTHPRDVNGHFNSDIQRENAMMELRKTINSSKKGVHRQ